MRIAVGNDHAAMEGPPPLFKPEIVRYLREQGHTVVDCGTNSPESVDYPDLAQAVCDTLLAGEADAGILMCGTGIGMSIAANRNPGIRAAVCATPEMARLSREHNNANVLCFGKRILSLQESLKIIDVWLATPFSEGERHVRRVCKMG
ncbi:MAG TPA: ribose 5-phosphate isomerase B [Candidatus Hydrogenedentes bacterium]|nr:ribose 5-phosphate isomerase B [Candidatus Hydrogenedentota bacterium]HQK75225.1 ribose 5-phosphate isomerase B [Candidatus Hydrogenedentota bacterium]